ncbi:uncharacterized protein YoxC [Bacillus ectoiniformans]|uniref:YtxH domain-containing protein n=1 Tax=Bacillus ectoiniformans TaxID=1494429 RepID=UPI001956AC89|nr:uncharacterized protein YoxC [Bacillus ectoiniformans]
MGKAKFFIGMAVGAVVGGGLTLTDRQTREEMKEWGKYLADLAKDPDQLKSTTMELVNRAKSTAEQVNEDVNFIREKVDSLKELTPEVKSLVSETKGTFLPDQGQDTSVTNESATR